MKRPPFRIMFFLTLSLTFVMASCSITSLAARALSSGSSGSSGGAMSVFMGEDDPEIVGDALPTLIKAAEALSANEPGNAAMASLVGKLYIMYANAFVEGPASMLGDEDFEVKLAAKLRARSFYLRGASYAARGLEQKHPGITSDPSVAEKAIPKLKKSQVDTLYWYAAGTFAAFALDPLDIGLSMRIPLARDLAYRALVLDPGYAALYDLFFSFHAGMPDSLGGDPSRVQEFFDKAVAASGGASPGPYVAWASSIDVANQDAASFRENLGKALAIDPEAHPDNKLMIVLSQRKARWLLEHIDDFILGE